MNKKLITAASIALAACVAIGGTIAYLWDSESVTNTFTVGNVNITLQETEGESQADSRQFSVAPGQTTPKDPKVWVDEGSEKAYLFVKVENTTKTDSVDPAITYEMAEGWNETEEDSGVYYRVVETTQQGDENAFSVFAQDQVTASAGIRSGETIVGDITVNAYAIQYAGFENDAAAAWTALQADMRQ